MQTLKVTVLLLIFGGFLLLLFNVTAQATLKYKKDTGKKCVFCHSGIPEPAEEDAQLNEDGEKFRENGYDLTEEQRD